MIEAPNCPFCKRPLVFGGFAMCCKQSTGFYRCYCDSNQHSTEWTLYVPFEEPKELRIEYRNNGVFYSLYEPNAERADIKADLPYIPPDDVPSFFTPARIKTLLAYL